jgi:hypothetical protein
MPAWADDTDDDKPLPEDAEIKAAFPTRSERHDLYGEAMRLVGARRSKGGLVALVTWLLLRAEHQRTEPATPEVLDAWDALVRIRSLVDRSTILHGVPTGALMEILDSTTAGCIGVQRPETPNRCRGCKGILTQATHCNDCAPVTGGEGT